jgi:hypothetical protein
VGFAVLVVAVVEVVVGWLAKKTSMIESCWEECQGKDPVGETCCEQKESVLDWLVEVE